MNAPIPNLTLAERERWAYANGDMETLALLQPAVATETELEDAQKRIVDLEDEAYSLRSCDCQE